MKLSTATLLAAGLVDAQWATNYKAGHAGKASEVQSKISKPFFRYGSLVRVALGLGSRRV